MGAELSIGNGQTQIHQRNHPPKKEEKGREKNDRKREKKQKQKKHRVGDTEEEKGKRPGNRSKTVQLAREAEEEAGGRRRNSGGSGGRARKASPGMMMHSPFRGLRRAASSSASSISCCSPAPCSASLGLLSSGPSYPYPRTHSTLMVIPSARPLAPVCPSSVGPIREWTPSAAVAEPVDADSNNNNEQLVLYFPHLPPGQQPPPNNNEGEPPGSRGEETEQQRQSLVAQYGFQTHRPRPPLNRAIPPIPESRSNESIQSGTTGRLQICADNNNNFSIQQQTVRMIDENNPIDVEMPLVEEEEGGMAEKEEEGEGRQNGGGQKTGRKSRLPKLMWRKKANGQGKEHVEGGQAHPPPKSPLLSVAHSVKTRLTKLTTSRQPKESLPMSRSLEIGRQQSRIPTKADPMTKSWSAEATGRCEAGEMPRRSPVTTLIPSPGIGPRRLPPDEETEGPKTKAEEEEPGAGGKQVQFAPIPEEWPELRRAPELEFTVWTPQKAPRGDKEESATVSAPFPSSVHQESELISSRPRTPPKMRKSPRSFPPLGVHSEPISLATAEEPPVRTARSALSVSFGTVDEAERQKRRRKKAEEEEEEEEEEERRGKRRVFSRSLRMVATRVCEASPMVARRRGRSAGRDGTGDRRMPKREGEGGGDREDQQRKEREGKKAFSAGLFHKRHSIPAEHQRAKSGSKSFIVVARENVRLRSVKSVTEQRLRKGKTGQERLEVAPLAESESSRVENSPAVEQCPPWEEARGGEAEGRRRKGFFGGKIKDKGRTSRTSNTTAGTKIPVKTTGRKDAKAIVAPPPPSALPAPSAPTSRPTLAELLASPLSRKKPTGEKKAIVAEAKGGGRGGLIDDEIGDQPMLISASSPSALGDFRLIDELSSTVSGPPSAAGDVPADGAVPGHPQSPSASSAPSSVLLVAEQWEGQNGGGREKVMVVQSRLESALRLGKRNARSRTDPKNAVAAEQRANGVGTGGHNSKPSTSATTSELAKCKSTGDAKSDDGASVVPSLLSDFRSDLVQLQDSVRRDLEELATLRLQNAVLREQLAERDRIIASLQRQLRGEMG